VPHSSRCHPCPILKANYPGWSRAILHKEALGLDGEPHLEAALRIALLDEAHRLLDALGLNRYIEVGGSLRTSTETFTI
jgi:hypothetical protein